MAWIAGGLAVMCLVSALVHLVRLVALPTDRIGEASHAVMGLGMAAMFSPVDSPVPAPLWIAVFALTGAWFGAAALRARSLAGEIGHHVVGSVAMLFMLLSGHSSGPDGGGGHAAHIGHGGGHGGGLGLGSVIAIVLAGYFVWHLLRCADRWRSARADAEPAPSRGSGSRGSGSRGSGSRTSGSRTSGVTAVATRLAPSVLLTRPAAAAAHLVMAALMAVMLLGMV